MTFQQLYYFYVVAECKSVTKAAATIYITQPALSMTLKKIEEELGTTLFEKHGRNIVLNDQGKT